MAGERAMLENMLDVQREELGRLLSEVDDTQARARLARRSQRCWGWSSTPLRRVESHQAACCQRQGDLLRIQEAARRLRDGGRIITMSSVNTVLVEPGASLYSASKAAIEPAAAGTDR